MALEKQTLVLITLDEGEFYQGLYDAIWSDDIDEMNRDYELQRIRSPADARRYLGIGSDPVSTRPVAILVPDPGLLKPEYDPIFDRVKAYAESGGVILFVGGFASNVRPDDMDRLWERLHKPWKMTKYSREDTVLNVYDQTP